MTLYEVNKMAYKNMPAIKDTDKIVELISKFLQTQKSRYYMLLNHENRYYTMFMIKVMGTAADDAAKEILDVALDLGTLKDVVANDNGALEFWIDYNGEPTMFVLFNYEQGVVEI